eukprot:1741602-Prymnesium_polylepis.2
MITHTKTLFVTPSVSLVFVVPHRPARSASRGLGSNKHSVAPPCLPRASPPRARAPSACHTHRPVTHKQACAPV